MSEAVSLFRCPYANDLEGKEAAIYKEAKRCAIADRLCWNWHKIGAIQTCEVKKRGGAV